MTPNDSVTHWIRRVKEGDRAGVEKLLEHYFQRLVQLARKKLQAREGLTGYEEDVALSALKSVCLGAERGRFPQLQDRDDLWRLLVVVTVRKAIDLLRGRKSREEAVEAHLEELLSAEPSPALAAEMAEECQRLFDLLDSPELRSIAHLKVEGYTNDEIAEKLGCVPRTVERKLQRIRTLWDQELSA
jgi:RNA polymerase sigma factor (sigma-70 family)